MYYIHYTLFLTMKDFSLFFMFLGFLFLCKYLFHITRPAKWSRFILCPFLMDKKNNFFFNTLFFFFFFHCYLIWRRFCMLFFNSELISFHCLFIPSDTWISNTFHNWGKGGRSTRYSDRLYDFSVTIPRCYKDVCINIFFPCNS